MEVSCMFLKINWKCHTQHLYPQQLFSHWNINGLKQNIIGNKLTNGDFIQNIKDHDLIFQTETWSKEANSIPGFNAISTITATPRSNYTVVAVCPVEFQACLKNNLKHSSPLKNKQKFLVVWNRSYNFKTNKRYICLWSLHSIRNVSILWWNIWRTGKLL